MKRFKPILFATAAAIAAGGCANFQPARPSAEPADAAYAEGRRLHMQLRFEPALAAYRRSVEARPAHAAAWTAMGALLSHMGEPAQAEDALRRALDADPRSSRALNNLGYHLLTQGRAEEAVSFLDRAAALAPRDATVQANLQQARSQALAQKAPEPRRASEAKQAPAAMAAPARAEAHGEPAPTLRMARVADGIFELSNGSAAPAAAVPAQAARPHQPAPAAPPAARVEVANGHGATGLARRVAGALGVDPARIRLTNHIPYGAERSRIEYAPAAEAAARALVARLPSPVPIVPAARPDARVDVRLLLGRDFPPGGQAVALLNP